MIHMDESCMDENELFEFEIALISGNDGSTPEESLEL